MKISDLVTKINETHLWFSKTTKIQINKNLTVRNWIFGLYIIEYEQEGSDRAKYGKKILIEIAHKLNNAGLKELNDRYLRNCRTFYTCYPQIWMTVSSISFPPYFNEGIDISSRLELLPKTFHISEVMNMLNYLSFSHFIELIKVPELHRREFYEVLTMSNQWSVRELRRSINSLLFERTGLSNDKNLVLKQVKNEEIPSPENIVKDPYILEFLGLEEKSSYSETDLEEAILNHLQKFLLELGKGFCFEARQKRITFGNKHYKIDLVFYHRILKCHVLFDLKIGEFDHSDSGQMNMYLNYYSENFKINGDTDPVGIILCAYKNNSLVHYSTGGMSQNIFVSKYLLNLPSEEELKQIIDEERQKLN